MSVYTSVCERKDRYLSLQIESVPISPKGAKRLLLLCPVLCKCVEAGEPEVVRGWTVKCQRCHSLLSILWVVVADGYHTSWYSINIDGSPWRVSIMLKDPKLLMILDKNNADDMCQSIKQMDFPKYLWIYNDNYLYNSVIFYITLFVLVSLWYSIWNILIFNCELFLNVLCLSSSTVKQRHIRNKTNSPKIELRPFYWKVRSLDRREKL